MNGFQITQLKNPGFVDRLFRRKPKENAYIEIQNKLAKVPIRDLPTDAVERVLTEYRLSFREARPHLRELYAKVLTHFVEDRELSDHEVDALKRLRDLFGLTDGDVAEAEKEIVHPIYRAEIQSAIEDRHLTAEEKERLENLVCRLRLPEDIAQEIYKVDTNALIQRVFNQAIADRRLSPEEEKQLHALAENFGGKIEHDVATAALLDRFRLMWRIEQGDRPNMPVSIHLQKTERCHAAIPATLYELRTITRAVRYSGPTARIRIAKGLSWRVGHVNVSRVSQEVMTKIDSGKLYITSKRLLLDGAKKNMSIQLNRIINFTLYKDGIQVEKDSGKDQFFECAGDLELLGVVLAAALTSSRK